MDKNIDPTFTNSMAVKTTQKILKSITKKLEYADSSDLLELILDIAKNVPLSADFLSVKLGIVQEREFLDQAKMLIDKELSKNYLKYNHYYGQKQFSFKKDKLRNILKDLKSKTSKVDLEIEFLIYASNQLLDKCLELFKIDDTISIGTYTVSILQSLFSSSCSLIAKKSSWIVWEKEIDNLIELGDQLFAKTNSYVDYWSDGEEFRSVHNNPFKDIKEQYLSWSNFLVLFLFGDDFANFV